MDWGSIVYLAMTFGLLLIFALIVFRTYRRKNRDKNEEAKYTMLDDD